MAWSNFLLKWASLVKFSMEGTRLAKRSVVGNKFMQILVKLYAKGTGLIKLLEDGVRFDFQQGTILVKLSAGVIRIGQTFFRGQEWSNFLQE